MDPSHCSKTLSRQFVTAQEEERQNISRELHDVVAQSLTGIILRLSALAPGSRTGTETRRKEIAEVQKLIIHAVAVVQRFARDLRPSMLDDLGLTPALASFLDHFSESTGISTRMTSVRLAGALNMEQRTALFQVVQEACNNVSRHAHATAIHMRVHRKGDHLCMAIHDNGQSFSVAAALQAHGRKRLGLLGMKERMRLIGGHLEITSSPKQGTTIVAMLPMSKIGDKASRCNSAPPGTEAPEFALGPGNREVTLENAFAFTGDTETLSLEEVRRFSAVTQWAHHSTHLT